MSDQMEETVTKLGQAAMRGLADAVRRAVPGSPLDTAMKRVGLRAADLACDAMRKELLAQFTGPKGEENLKACEVGLSAIVQQAIIAETVAAGLRAIREGV